MALKTIGFMNAPQGVDPEELRKFLPAGSLEQMPWVPEFQRYKGLGYEKDMAQRLLEKGSDSSPAKSGWEALSRVLAGATGGWQQRTSDRKEEDIRKGNMDVLKDVLESNDISDPRVLAALMTSPDKDIQATGASLLSRVPTDVEKKRLGLEESRIGLAQEAEDRARDEGVTEAFSRSAGQDLQRQQIMNQFNQNMEENDPERLKQIARNTAEANRDFATPPAGSVPLSDERQRQELEQIRAQYPWLNGSGGTNQTPITGIGDVTKPPTGIAGSDIKNSFGFAPTAARAANSISGFFGGNAGFEGVRDSDVAIANIRPQAQATVGAIQATGRPSVFHLEMVDQMLPKPGMFTNPDTALKQYKELKSIAQQDLKAGESYQPGTASQAGAHSAAQIQLKNFINNLDAIIMKTEQGSADRNLPEKLETDIDDFRQSLGGQ